MYALRHVMNDDIHVLYTFSSVNIIVKDIEVTDSLKTFQDSITTLSQISKYGKHLYSNCKCFIFKLSNEVHVYHIFIC